MTPTDERLAYLIANTIGRDTSLALRELQQRREFMREARELLLKARVPHLVVDDCWYSCPLSGECCNDLYTNADTRSRCNCGADAQNAHIDAILTRMEGLT